MVHLWNYCTMLYVMPSNSMKWTSSQLATGLLQAARVRHRQDASVVVVGVAPTSALGPAVAPVLVD